MSATTLTGPEPRGLSLTETLSDARVLAARQLRKVLRRPTFIVFAFVQPVMFVLLFFSWISAFIGLTVRDPETAQSAGFIWIFPLTFVSSAFVTTSSMPGVVEAFAQVNPVTLAVDATRAMMIGDGDALGPALGTLAWLAVLLLVFVALSVRALRRA